MCGEKCTLDQRIYEYPFKTITADLIRLNFFHISFVVQIMPLITKYVNLFLSFSIC